MPTPRRRPWGLLWSAAPWDGRAKPPAPLRIPNTAAAPIAPPTGRTTLRRQPFGRMLASAPWAGPAAVVPEAARTDGRIDFGLPAGPDDDETIPNTLSARARSSETRS